MTMPLGLVWDSLNGFRALRSDRQGLRTRTFRVCGKVSEGFAFCNFEASSGSYMRNIFGGWEGKDGCGSSRVEGIHCLQG